MSAEFFYFLSKQIADQGLTERARRDKLEALRSENLNFEKDCFGQLDRLMSDYNEKLQSLGYSSHKQKGERSVKLSLIWSDQARLVVEYKVDSETNGFIATDFEFDASSELIKSERREINRSDWNLEDEEKYLQACIQDFTNEALDHGGL